MKEGENDLEIRGTNLWPNRLIGDENLKDESERQQRVFHRQTAKFAKAMQTNSSPVRIPAGI